MIICCIKAGVKYQLSSNKCLHILLILCSNAERPGAAGGGGRAVQARARKAALMGPIVVLDEEDVVPVDVSPATHFAPGEVIQLDVDDAPD